ncbi:hypothetical protein LTR82_000720 [Friedmanniomyces endolithicus]|uniref:Wings apart-like protein C-terminal domain-containing protein n=1 Tax=Friedmanniomyces endolithicus TaxID=329885 RepID=A0AAN6JG28_9PEZI|nr:hypothetical protein LTR82_000720 [Friedmanniomyces endolithicus]
MATVSTAPLPRPKKLVRYGKTSSRTTFSTTNASHWLKDEEGDITSLQHGPTRVATVEWSDNIRKTEGTKREADAEAEVKKREVTNQISKPVRPAKKLEDLFDVPSSEDEARTEFVLTHVSPSRFSAKRVLVDDTAPKVPSWLLGRRLGLLGNARPEHQTEPETALDTANVSGGTQPSSRKVLNHANSHEGPATASQTARLISQPMSAAARLAARRQQGGITRTTISDAVKSEVVSNKRAQTTADAAVAAPRKRSRRSPPAESNQEDALVCDVPLKPVRKILSHSAESAKVGVDVYAFPEDPAESAVSRLSSIADRSTASRIRRSPTSSSPLPTAKKGLSAPARLREMSPDDAHSIDTGSHSPSARRSSPSTPRRSAMVANVTLPSTPLAPVDGSLQTALEAASALTPRQAQLWSQLLASDPPAPTPSSLAINQLTLGGQRRIPGAGAPRSRKLLQSSSDVTGMDRRRTRLVDRLKASMPSSEDESSEDDSDEEMEGVVTHSKVPLKEAAEPEEGVDGVARGQQSQTQSQSAAAEAGSRITYARTRSYLPEDNLEDGLMFDLPSVTPLQPSALTRDPSKTNLDSQQSAFDIEDSDDEAAPGRMRTIHELRAAGRNSRFMQETEGILEDIADHAASARSRRRGALVELATKFMDKSYVERFVGQGFELKLVAEVTAKTEDPIGDFVLAAAFAFLLVAEPNAHCVTSLRSGGLTGWLSAMLGDRVELGKLAKDRKSNMSKSAQGTLLEFAKSVQTQTSLWGELTLGPFTQRLVALRTLDLLIGRLRRLGDKAELLDGAQLNLVLPSTTAKEHPLSADPSIAISLLEALSSSAQAPAWPTEVLERLEILLPSLGESADMPTHTIFLALRLTLNITNDNARNCDIFAREETVHYLLTSIESGFAALDAPSSLAKSTSSPCSPTGDQHSALSYDLLVLALGSTINLFEHSVLARSHALSPTNPPNPTPPPTLLSSLLTTLTKAQTHLSTASSLTASSHNVAIGYLAVALANLCQDGPAREYIASKLPGGGLGVLVEGVEEFVQHHQCADREMEAGGEGGGGGAFGGEEGREVWGGFTERLRGVLGKLREVA